MEEDEMVEWHHGLDGHESEQALGVGDGQGSLACCIPWDCKESDMTKRLNLSELYLKFQGEIGMGNTCNSMADSCERMTKPTAIL